MAITRRQARRLAMQILFANEFLKEDYREVAARVLKSLGAEADDFTMELVRLATEQEEQLNRLIAENLRNWDLQRVAVFDRVLLRMALAEMLNFPDIPPEVTINEAIEICKEFCNTKSRRFINGILDAIFKKMQQGKLPTVPFPSHNNSTSEQ